MNDPLKQDELVTHIAQQLDGLSVRNRTVAAEGNGHATVPLGDQVRDRSTVSGDGVDLTADLAVVMSIHEQLQQRLSGIGS